MLLMMMNESVFSIVDYIIRHGGITDFSDDLKKIHYILLSGLLVYSVILLSDICMCNIVKVLNSIKQDL